FRSSFPLIQDARDGIGIVPRVAARQFRQMRLRDAKPARIEQRGADSAVGEFGDGGRSNCRDIIHAEGFGGGAAHHPGPFATELPLREVPLRFPCFTTVAPPVASTNAAAVETLNKSMPSPPVPHASIIGPGNSRSSSSSGTARCSKARAKLAISEALSPFSWSAV